MAFLRRAVADCQAIVAEANAVQARNNRIGYFRRVWAFD